MEILDKEGQKMGEILLDMDKVRQFDEDIQRNNENDQQEENMISHQQIVGKCHTNKQVILTSNVNNIPTHSHTRQNNKLMSYQESQILNMSQMSLKSAIVFLLLLGMILVGVYKMIEQIYQIQHPQLQMEKRITSSRVNMVRQENSLVEEKQQMKAQLSNEKNTQLLSGDSQELKQQTKQQSKQQAHQLQENQISLQTKKSTESIGEQIVQKDQTSTQPIDQPQLPNDNIVIDNKLQQVQKQQALNFLNTNQLNDENLQNTHEKDDSTKRQQAQSQLRQKEQYIQQFQSKDDKKQDQSQQPVNKEQTLDQVKEQPQELNENVDIENTKIIDQTQTQKKEVLKQMLHGQEVKINSRIQAPINPPNQQKIIVRAKQQPALVIQQRLPINSKIPPPTKLQQQRAIPPVSPRLRVSSQPQSHPQSHPKSQPRPQSRSSQSQPKPFVPTAKAGISKQQAIKWKQYQTMISLPLQARADSKPMLLQEYLYYQKKYNISKYAQLPICVVVPTFNNVENNRYQDNLKSILQQNYTNYHVVIIDDKSQDKTGELINHYIKTLDPKYESKIKVIINQQRKMAMPNLRYAAMNQCQQNQLFIIVDGDDLLIGRQVFKLFSAVMQQRNYWVMWTNFLSPKGAIGYSRQYPAVHKQSNNYRKAGFVMSHLRAYYTKLFRLIKDQDLKDQNGEFFHAANDVAIGVPILQMAHKHAGYVPELNYYYNMYTGLNNHKIRLKEQKANDKLIRKKPRYQALATLDFSQTTSKVNKMPQDILPITSMNLKVQNT